MKMFLQQQAHRVEAFLASPSKDHSMGIRFGYAVGLVGAALIIQLIFWDTFVHVPFFLFWPAVILSAWFGGLWPGLLATTASVFLINYFFLTPYNTILPQKSDLLLGGLFALFTIYLSWLRHRQQLGEELFQKQKEELRVTISSIGDGVITTDEEAFVIFLNPVAEQLTGWKQADASGRDIRDIFKIVHGTTREPVQIPALEALRTGKSVGLANNTILIGRDGTERFIADSGAPIVNIKGETIGSVLVFRDVTERYQIQRDIADSQERYRSFIANSSEGIWRIELEQPVDTSLSPDEQIDQLYQHGVLAECNDAMAQMYGFERSEEIIGARLGDLVIRSDPNNIEYLRTFIHSDYRLLDGESHELGRDGRSKYFLNNLIGIREDGKLVRGWGTQRDITERKYAEDRARLLQSVTAGLIDPLTQEEVAEVIVSTILGALGSSVGTIFVLSEDKQNLLMLNRKGLPDLTYEQYRLLPANFPGPLTDAIGHQQAIWIESFEDYVRLYPQFEANIRENGTQASACIPFKIHDRTTGGITISFKQRRVFTPEDRALLLAVAQLCGQAIERARLYEVEREARIQAEEADRLKLQFLAMISHELRTPLTSIKGFASTMLASDIIWDAESQHEFIQIIDQESDRLTELVDELLDLSRLQAGKLEISPAPQPVEDIIETAKTELDELAKNHLLVVSVTSLPTIMADSRRIVQVLTNLVSNAAKYSPERTSITITVKQDGQFIQFDVADEGVGISSDLHEIVFEAFSQGENAKMGAGLGLAICKGLIEAHGGRIWIQDNGTPGTTISFTIPIAKQ